MDRQNATESGGMSGRAILGSSGKEFKSTLSANAPEFVPRMYQPTAQYQARQPQQPTYTFTGSAVDRLRQAVAILIASPGTFDEIMKPLTDSLQTVIKDETTLCQIVEEIVQQSIREANFRYTGARICNYFSHSLKLECGKFRASLLKRCQEEYGKKKELASSQATRDHLMGFTLFMAELLTSMTIEDGGRMIVLAEGVCELLTCLLDQSQDSCLKCAVQVLKLSGAILEETEKSQNPDGKTPKLEETFSKIKQLLVEDSTKRNMKSMLLSVVELRATDWGKKEKEPASNLNGSAPPNYPNNGQPNQAIYYDEHGNPLNLDEAGYIPEDYLEYWAGGDEEYYEYYYGQGDEYAVEDEFDEEIAAAFEEFMRDNNKNQRSPRQ